MHYKGLTYLALLLVVAPLTAWRLALSGTWHTWRQGRSEARQLSELPALQTPHDELSSVRARMALDTVEYIRSGLIIERLLPEASKYGVSVVRYSPFATEQEGEMSLRTAEMTLSGSFHGIVRVIDRLERDIPSCRIASVNFRTIRRNNKPAQLVAQLIIRQITITKQI